MPANHPQVSGFAPGGATIAKVASAATTNATLVKGSEGRIFGYALTNTTAAFKYVKFYNKATAPVVGTDVPVFTLGLPPNSTTVSDPIAGFSFTTGIGFGITGAVAEADTTATAANDVVGAIFYA